MPHHDRAAACPHPSLRRGDPPRAQPETTTCEGSTSGPFARTAPAVRPRLTVTICPGGASRFLSDGCHLAPPPRPEGNANLVFGRCARSSSQKSNRQSRRFVQAVKHQGDYFGGSVACLAICWLPLKFRDSTKSSRNRQISGGNGVTAALRNGQNSAASTTHNFKAGCRGSDTRLPSRVRHREIQDGSNSEHPP